MNDPNSPFVRALTSGNFLTGVLVGAVTTIVFTNPGVQRALFRTAARTADLIKGSVAEAKERFHDAEAEVHMEAGEETEAR